jgi:hypothetical protein
MLVPELVKIDLNFAFRIRVDYWHSAFCDCDCVGIAGNTAFFGVIFPRDCLRNLLFIIAVIFEVKSDGAGEREACSNVRCSRLSGRHGCGFRFDF